MFSPNTGKYGPEKTLYLDTFQAVNNQLSNTDQLRYNANNSKMGINGATETKIDNSISNSGKTLEC